MELALGACEDLKNRVFLAMPMSCRRGGERGMSQRADDFIVLGDGPEFFVRIVLGDNGLDVQFAASSDRIVGVVTRIGDDLNRRPAHVGNDALDEGGELAPSPPTEETSTATTIPESQSTAA